MNVARGAGTQPRVITGSDGRFVFRDLPKGAVGLQVALAGYVPGSAGQSRPNGPSRAIELEEAERLTNVTIRLWRYGVITGTVLDDSGEPAVGVTSPRRGDRGPRGDRSSQGRRLPGPTIAASTRMSGSCPETTP